MAVATEKTLPSTTDVDDAAVEDTAGEDESGGTPDTPGTPPNPASLPRRAIAVAAAAAVALAALVGWLGVHLYQSHHAQAQKNAYLQVARQGAVNLTTIDWQHADADVHRILDSATGEFYDDFARRSQPFIDMVKQSQAKTVGIVKEAAMESQTADSARALVAVSVVTTSADEQGPTTREWRMRIDVQKVGDQLKVSNVGFVP